MKCFQLSPGAIRDSLMPVHQLHRGPGSAGKPFLPCAKSSAIRQKFEKYARLNFN